MRYTREDGCRAWLTQAMIPPSTLLQLFEQFGSAEAIYEEFLESDTTALQPYITPKSIKVLKQYASRDEMHKIMLAMNNAQMQIMAYSDAISPIPCATLTIRPFCCSTAAIPTACTDAASR